MRGVYRKMHLPNYAVFDEQRYFIPGEEPITIEVGGETVGLTICEDCWTPGPPAATEAERARQRAERGDAPAFDFGPPIEDAIARAEEETGLPGPAPAKPLRWSPLESPEAAMERARG